MEGENVGGGCGYRMRDNAMQCDADDGSIRYKVSTKKEQVVRGKVQTNFLAGEVEQPLKRQLDFDLDLPFNTVDNALLEALLSPDRRNRTGVCKNTVV